MTQRTAAHIGIWLMVVAGILFLINVFVVPYFAEVLLDMSDGRVSLPGFVQFIFNLSHFAVQYSWFFASLYMALFIAVIIWYRKSGSPANMP